MPPCRSWLEVRSASTGSPDEPLSATTPEETARPRMEPGQSASIDGFMRDYVDHLKHHVRQIDALGSGEAR